MYLTSHINLPNQSLISINQSLIRENKHKLGVIMYPRWFRKSVPSCNVGKG